MDTAIEYCRKHDIELKNCKECDPLINSKYHTKDYEALCYCELINQKCLICFRNSDFYKLRKKCKAHNRSIKNDICNNCLLNEIKRDEIIDTCCCDEIHPMDIPCVVCEAVDQRLEKWIQL